MTHRLAHRVSAQSRREFLSRAGGGCGALALSYLLGGRSVSVARGAESATLSPLAPKEPHYDATAKAVIWIFIDGGPSQIDLFDPKPLLNKIAGQPLPAGIERAFTPMGVSDNPILGCQRKWKQHGDSGLWLSDWLPHLANHADDLCVIRSCWANGLNHVGSVCQMNTGVSAHGSRMASAARTGTCLRSPCYSTSPTNRPAVRGIGAPALCQPRTKAHASAATARRFCTSPRPRASRKNNNAASSTCSPS
jgi:hypothetical protein